MKTLWLGLNPQQGAFHYPMIKIVPLEVKIPKIRYTHLIVTSQTSVDLLPPLDQALTVLAVGQKTAAKLKGYQQIDVSKNESAEGVVELLKKVNPINSSILYPHSKKARPVIKNYLSSHNYHFVSIELYDVVFQKPDPKPDLGEFDKIVFTSPSCVDAFFYYFGSPPKHLFLHCIGHITQHHLTKKLDLM